MKILCVLYDDPKDGMPKSYPLSELPKLKNGSNSFNSFPYCAGWDLIEKDAENAKINTPIIIRWFNFKENLSDWSNMDWEFNRYFLI